MTNQLKNQIFFDGSTKGIPLNRYPKEAWTFLTGGEEGGDLQKLYKKVPWLFRGIKLRVDAVGSMPFEIMKGSTTIDTSWEYQNVLGFLPNPGIVLGLVEASLALTGKAYLFNALNPFNISKELRYLLPTSVRPKIGKMAGLEGFTRQIGGETHDFEVKDITYFWYPDPYVEIGPPKGSPGQAAMAAAGVLMNVDDFAALFFKRGAIKATVFTVSPQTQKAERLRFRDWVRQYIGRGMENAHNIEVIASDAASAVVVGEGISELSNTELTKEKREDIATALGIPQTKLFSQAANYATARQDDLDFNKDTIVPECGFIEDRLNEQVLRPQGYSIRFRPEMLESFQEEEVDRSAAFVNLVRGKIPPIVAMQILGFDLPPDMDFEQLQILVDEFAAQAAANNPFAGMLQQGKEEDEPPKRGREKDGQKVDLMKWRKKSIKSVKAGEPAAVDFVTDQVDPVLAAAIDGQLKGALDEDEVNMIFEDAMGIWRNYP